MSGTGHTTRSVAWSGDQHIDGILYGTAWADSTIYYTFPGTGEDYGYSGEPDTYHLISPISQSIAIRFALDKAGGSDEIVINPADDGFSVEGFTNLTVSVGYDPSAPTHLRFGNTGTPVLNSSVAWAYYPGGGSKAGDVWFYDPDNPITDLKSPSAGNYAWYVHLYEIGAALGMDDGYNPVNWALPSEYNSMEYSVMGLSYVGAPPDSFQGNGTWSYPQTYMMADIAALQYMYGADFTTNGDDTVYSWTSNSGATYVNGMAAIVPGANYDPTNPAIEPGSNTIFLTVWDGGGNDTYDLSAYSTNALIDLRPGSYSNFATGRSGTVAGAQADAPAGAAGSTFGPTEVPIDPASTQRASLGDGHYASGNVYNALQYHGDPRSLIENAIGGNGADTLIGNQAANLLDGGPGSDTVDYSHSSTRVGVYLDAGRGFGGDAQGDILTNIENLIGTDFSAGDFLTGTDGANKIQANGGNDIVKGLGGDDDLYGGAGDDTVEGGAGADTMDGGDGIDALSYANSVNGVEVTLFSLAPRAMGGDAEGDVFFGFENLIGSNSSVGDILIGGFGPNMIAGLGGPDQIDGFDAFGDTADYSASTARVGVYLDTGLGFGGDAQGDTLTRISNLIGSNALPGDFLTGNENPNTIYGMAGNDTIKGGDGDDWLIGGTGADILDGGSGIDTTDYSASVARVGVYLDTGLGFGGDAQGDTLVGVENLIGTNSSAGDYLTGNATDNVIVGLGGGDYIDGKGGSDTVDYSASISRVGVYLNTGLGFGGDAQGDRLANIENVIGTGFGDFLVGDAGPNWLAAGAGDDHIAGLGGADQLEGGDGIDTADYSASASRVGVYLNTHTALGGDAQGDVLTSIENLIGTKSAVGDYLTGDANDNVIAGLAGPDQINGMGGIDTADYSASASRVGVYLNTHAALGGDAQGDVLTSIENLIGTKSAVGDYLTGDAGNNVIAGLAGPDRIDGMGGNDTADYSASASRVGVYLNTHTALGGDAQGDVLTSIENLIGTKSAVGDYLTGDAGNNVIAGLAGPDRIDGMGGNDTADYSASLQRVGVYLDSGTGYGGDAQGDVLVNIENLIGSDIANGDFLKGNVFANDIQGGGGDDWINGMSGSDTLNGGSGNDTLAGGSGGDTFLFTGAFGVDHIIDFEDDIDTIVFKGAGAPTETYLDGNDQVFTFATGAMLIVDNSAGMDLMNDMYFYA